MHTYSRLLFVSAISLLVPTTALAGGAYKPGDQVLAMREGTNSFFVATVKTAVDMEGGSVTFLDGTVQEYGPITFEPSLRAMDWKVGTQIECSADVKTTAEVGDADSDKLTKGAITAIDATTPATVELGKTKFPLAACRYHRTWWDELSARWRDWARYPMARAMPRQGAGAPRPDEVTSALSEYLSSADGGGYIVIKRCVTTGKGWVKMNSGSELTARTIDVACAIAVPLPPKPRENFACLVEYGTCRQAYQGEGVFGACEWKYQGRDPDQIKCGAVK